MRSVIHHDAYDTASYRDTLKFSPPLVDLIKTSGASVPGAAELVEDLFYSFYRAQPTLVDESDLPPSAQVARTILSEIMGTTEYDAVRQAGTVGDQFYSGIATATVAKSLLTAFDAKLLKKLQALREAEEEAEKLFAQAETLEDLAEGSTGDKAARLHEQAKQARKEAEQDQEKAEQLHGDIEESSEAIEDTARQTGRAACEEAEAAVEEAEAAVATFNGDSGRTGSRTGGHSGGGGGMSLKEKVALATKVGKSKHLLTVAAICGRMTRIALQVQRTKVLHPPDEIVGVTIGSDLDRVVPSDLALLSDPALRILFLKKFGEGQLLQLDLRGSEKQGRGPIIVALDSSSSMEDYLGGGATKEEWSKGVSLALLAIARKQKRDMAILHFAHVGALEVFFFEKGEATSAELIRTTEFFFKGGTAYQTWMQKALQVVEQSRFNRADVICVSDGEVSISSALESDWNRRRRAKDMRCYSVLLGNDGASGPRLARISDGICTINDLTQDNEALQMMFAV